MNALQLLAKFSSLLGISRLALSRNT